MATEHKIIVEEGAVIQANDLEPGISRGQFAGGQCPPGAGDHCREE